MMELAMKKLVKGFKNFGSKLMAWPHIDIAMLSAAILTYAGLAAARIASWSIWFDEAFTAYITRFNVAEIAHYTGNDMHPPLYYWLIKGWTSVFGTNEVGFRSFSLVFAIVTIILGFLLLKKLFSRQAAIIGVWLLALSPMLIRFGDEARMYTMVTAIALGATYVLVRAMATNRRKYWITYGLLLVAGMLTHYFIALVWLAHWVWRYVYLRIDGDRGKKLAKNFFSKSWVWTHVLAVGIFAVWLPTAIHQFSVLQAGFWIPTISADTFTNYLTNILMYLDHNKVESWLALLYFAIVVGSIVLLYRTYRNIESKKDRQNILLISCLAVVPPLILLLLSMPPLTSSFIDRYLMTSIVALALLMAIAITHGNKKRWLPIVMTLLILVSFGIGIDRVYYYGNYNKISSTSIRTKELIAAIAEKAKPGEPLIATDPWIFYEAIFYNSDEHPIYFLDQTTEYIYGSLDMLKDHDQFKIKNLDAFTKQHEVVWYFGNVGDNEITPPSIAHGWKQIDSVSIYNSIDDNSSYKAVRFETQSR